MVSMGSVAGASGVWICTILEKVLRVREKILEKGLGERVAHVAKIQIGGFRIDSKDGLESIKTTTCYRRKEEVSRDYSLIGEVVILGESEKDEEAVGMAGCRRHAREGHGGWGM